MTKILTSLLNKLRNRMFRSEKSELTQWAELPSEDLDLIRLVSPYTMTSVARMVGLVDAVRYIHKHQIAGDFVECGVWRGGSMMLVAKTLISLGDTDRNLYLFDTYEGMSMPTQKDRSFDGQTAHAQLAADTRDEGVWCRASIEDVRQNLTSTGYPLEKIHFVRGKVEDTIPKVSPATIALLRLDTDWYESTAHELKYLYPSLSQYGILILDDYGHWRGAKDAVDEFLTQQTIPLHLNRLDFTGRLVVKP